MQQLLYWEKQDAGLCAVHTINSLLQGRNVSEIDLMEVAQKLDAEESQLLGGAAGGGTAGESNNVSADGNFSVQVIQRCLESFGVHLVRHSPAPGQPLPTAFVLNHHEHWIALRKFPTCWFNLDSTERRPIALSDFTLQAYLDTMKMEGYSVFAIFDQLPGPDLSAAEGAPPSGVADESVIARVGDGYYIMCSCDATAQRWRPADRTTAGEDAREASNAASAVSGGAANLEDEMLAKAIAASLEQT